MNPGPVLARILANRWKGWVQANRNSIEPYWWIQDVSVCHGCLNRSLGEYGWCDNCDEDP